MQNKSIIHTVKSPLFSLINSQFQQQNYVSYAVKPISRESRVAASQPFIFALLDKRQTEFLEFVLSKYIESGVEELDGHLTVKL